LKNRLRQIALTLLTLVPWTEAVLEVTTNLAADATWTTNDSPVLISCYDFSVGKKLRFYPRCGVDLDSEFGTETGSNPRR
jgi:hypothetical protein